MPNHPPRITAEELQSLLADQSLTLIDVLPEDSYAAAHISGALNACVYEVAFPEKIQELKLDPAKPVVVYGLDQQAAPEAAERLAGIGFSDVKVLRGGRLAWEAAGFSVEGSEKSHGPGKDATLEIDAGESKLRWTGRNLMNQHWGEAKIARGEFDLVSGVPVCGEFVVDLTQLHCEDLKDNPQLHDGLIGHLQSEDFFHTELWPEARFLLMSATPLREQVPSSPNLIVEGQLTLHGVTRPLTFEVIHGVSKGQHVFQGHFDLDRTEWNIRYGSGKFFEALGMHLVSDLISFQITLVAKEK